LSDGVGHGWSSHSHDGSLSARTLRDVGGARNDGDSATDGQSLTASADEACWVNDLGVDDGSDGTSNSSASVSASIASSHGSASIACRSTWSESSRESDHRSRCDYSGAGGTRTVCQNSGSCNHGWDSTDCDSLAAVASQRGWVDKFSDLGHSRKSGDIARRVGRSWRRYRVSSGVEVDSLGSRTGLSDNLGDCGGRTCVASLGARSCSRQTGQAEEACEMEPGVHVGHWRTKV
jgi:hypothetical protein